MRIVKYAAVTATLATLAAMFAVLLWAGPACAEPPSSDELAPLVIPPPETMKVSTFAKNIDEACTDVLAFGGAGPGAAGATFSIAALAMADANNAIASLRATCVAIRDHKTLSVTDLANLREFRTDPEKGLDAIQKKIPNGTKQGPATLLPSSFGSIESTLVEGLATFIYERAKAEALLYVEQELNTLLCGTDTKPLFPHVCAALDSLDTNLSLQALGGYLAAAARRDVQQLPDRGLVYAIHDSVLAYNGVEKSVKDKQVNDAEGAKKRGELVTALDVLFAGRVALAYYQAVAGGRAPLEVARSLHSMKLVYDPAPEVSKGVRFASTLVDAVAQQDLWRTLDEKTPPQKLGCYALATVLSLEEMWRAEMPGVALKLSSGDGSSLDVLTAQIPVISGLMVQLSAITARAEKALSDKAAAGRSFANANGGVLPPGVKAKQQPEVDPQRFTLRDYVVATTQTLTKLLESGGGLAQSFGVMPPSDMAAMQSALRLAALGEQLAGSGNASEVLMLSLDLFEDSRQLLTAGGVNPPAALVSATKTASLLVQLADAKSAGEANNVLQAAAAPIGTYQTKYKKGVVALNALAGVSAGDELVSGISGDSAMLGAFAPVGLHATMPFASSSMHVGAFLSILNLGSLVSARFNDNATTSMTPSGMTTTAVNKSPTVNLTNLVTPGLFLTLGIAGSPFLVGAGAQVLPAGREIDTTTNGMTTSSTAPAAQVLGFLAVDVPIFPL